METLHARILDGEVIEWAVWGEILLNLNAPNPSSPVRFDFQIFNSDSMQKVAPNSAVLTAGPQGSYVAMIPAGTDAPLCVMKYKVDTDLSRAKKQVPIELAVKWQCTKQNTVIDVDYKATQGSNTPLMDLKFLIGQRTHARKHIRLARRLFSSLMFVCSVALQLWLLRSASSNVRSLFPSACGARSRRR